MLSGKDIVISFVTELELLSFPKLKKSEIKVIKELISECQVIGINQSRKNQTIEYRNRYGLKLPDAIIASSADYFNVPLLTTDTSFDKIDDINIIIYQA